MIPNCQSHPKLADARMMSFAKLFDRVDKLVSVLPLPIPRKGIKIIIIDELPLSFTIESILGKVANVQPLHHLLGWLNTSEVRSQSFSL